MRNTKATAHSMLKKLRMKRKDFVLTLILSLCAVTFLIFQILANSLESPISLMHHLQLKKEESVYSAFISSYEEILHESYSDISDCISRSADVSYKINRLYLDTMQAVVCSDTNRIFSSLQKEYEAFTDLSNDISVSFAKYEESYTILQTYVSKLNCVRSSKDEPYFSDIPSPEDVSNLIAPFLEREKRVTSIYEKAHQLADALYEKCLVLFSHLVYAELHVKVPIDADSAKELCWIANVIENRWKSPRFPNSPYEVIYAPGPQYGPAFDGSINEEPPEEVYELMSLYLRGQIDTGMPDNVLYQSMEELGDFVWGHLVHYFCGDY